MSIGYANNSNAYQLFVHRFNVLDIKVNIIIESKDVIFFENVLPYKKGSKSISLKEIV